MIITWYGHSCFKIQTRPQRGEDEVVIATDPFDKSIGLTPPQFKADIVTVSHSHFDHANTQSLKGDPFVIDAPGEYSLGGITIEGIESFHDNQKGQERGRNTIFVIESEEMRVCHLGDLGHALEEKQVEQIGRVDVLMIPVGGNFTVEPKKAEEVIGQLEPGVIIPMHFKVPGLNLEVTDEKPFITEFGAKVEEKLDKLTLKKKDLEEVENKVVVLEVAR
jgi:L-ascorbate metabolism protein UlaG (beta-lactamase superfamily)